MAEMFPDSTTGHEQTFVLKLRIGSDMVAKDVDSGIDQRDGERKESGRAILLVLRGRRGAEGGHPGEGVIERCLLNVLAFGRHGRDERGRRVCRGCDAKDRNARFTVNQYLYCTHVIDDIFGKGDATSVYTVHV